LTLPARNAMLAALNCGPPLAEENEMFPQRVA
jgi:hypothetical protein